jgi:hypothetical protein
MRALFVTPFPPPRPSDVQAMYGRLRTFVGALGTVADDIEMLHFVPAGHSSLAIDPRQMNESQSARWGRSVTVTLATTRRVDQSAIHLALSLVSGLSHPAYSPFVGRQQTAALHDCLERRPDIMFVHRLMGMGPPLRIHRQLPPILFDLDDVEHWVKIRMALVTPSWFAKVPRLLQVPSLLALERRAIRMASRTFVCSETDRQYLQRWGLTGIVMIPNAVAVPLEPPPVVPEKTIMLIVHSRVPQAKLIIAGSSPELIPAFSRHPQDVEFTGLVDDLNALYGRSRVICCPLLNGGGTRVKLIEAAAFAKPIVSTAIGAEGLSFGDGTSIVIREDDQSIANACIQLLGDDSSCGRLGLAAYREARTGYDRDAVTRLIATEAQRVLG